MPTYGEGTYGGTDGTYGTLLFSVDPGPDPDPDPDTPTGVLEPAIPSAPVWGAMTLGQARSRLRMRLNEAEEGAWLDPELNEWINEGQREVARSTMHLEATAEFAAVANTQSYVPSALSSAMHVDRVEYLPEGQTARYALEYRDFRNLEGVWWTAQSQTIGIPEFYTLWGGAPSMKLVVYPTPSVAGKFRVYFWRAPVPLETDDSVLEVPAGWEDLVVDYGEYLALRRDRDPRWREAKAQFDERLDNLIRYTSRHTPHPGSVDFGGASGQLDWLYGGGW